MNQMPQLLGQVGAFCFIKGERLPMPRTGTLPEKVVLYRSESVYQKPLIQLLEKWSIKYYQAAYLAEMENPEVIEKCPCALAIIEEKRAIEFLRSVMHYFTWTQRVMLSGKLDVDLFTEAINRAHVNYFIPLPLQEELLKTYLIKANRRFQNIIRPINKLEALTTVTTDLIEDNLRYRSEALTDVLTGLLNRRSLNTWLENLWHQYLRTGINFSMAILDIDHFKKINDTYGHSFGDHVLVKLANLIQNNLRKGQDYAFRYGGEEFTVISVNLSKQQMALFMERLLKLTRNMGLTFNDQPVNFTFSAGVAHILDAKTPQDIILQADKALYQAKNSGRNRVVVWENS